MFKDFLHTSGVACRTVWTVRSCAYTSISGLLPPVQKFLMVASSGRVLTILNLLMSHVTHLGYQADSCRQELGPRGVQVLGPCPYAGLLQACCGAKAPPHRFRLPNFFGDGPEVADGCKFRSCAYTSVSCCLITRRTWDPNFGVRVLGPCPCASQISWLVAVYEYPCRGRATASGPCTCAGR